MDLYGLVRVQDVHVVEGLLEELLLIFISDVLVQGDVVEKDPHEGVKQPWAVGTSRDPGAACSPKRGLRTQSGR